jgi:hypothetical protein
MPSRKARYNAPPTLGEVLKSGGPPKLRDFSEELRNRLRDFYPDKNAQTDPTFGHPADNFAAEILSEAGWAIGELEEVRQSLTKQDIRAEHDDLIRTLTATRDKLRKLSPDLDRLIGVDADTLGCADALDALLAKVEVARSGIDARPKKRRPDQAQHAIAVEMAIRVLRVAKDHGSRIAATGNSDLGYTSDAVQILKAIGDDIGLVLSDMTWRDITAEAKKAAGDLDK